MSSIGPHQHQHQLRAYSQQTSGNATKKNAQARTNHDEDDKETSKNHPVLPHLNTQGHMHMTNVGSKPTTQRYARASCRIHFTNPITYEALTATSILGNGSADANTSAVLVKGDVFAAARVAGIMAAKKTPDIVPLCHPSIGVDSVSVDISLVGPTTSTTTADTIGEYGAVEVVATVTSEGRTGVEMEAMTAVMGAALTVYDMCKANDKGMVIDGVKLLEKRGGKSGIWRR